MSRKEENEEIIGTEFLKYYYHATGRQLSIRSRQDKPDLLCHEDLTNKTIGIEITELLDQKDGKDRALNRITAQNVVNVLKKYASGGIVSIGDGAILPDLKENVNDLRDSLDAAVCKAGGLEAFVRVANSKGWEYKQFRISHISIIRNKREWIPITDTPLLYQLNNIVLEKVMKCVLRKAQSSKYYKKTDELFLLIRNPHTRWEPTNDEKQKIAALKGEYINSIWLFNLKMNTLPVQPDIIRIDY